MKPFSHLIGNEATKETLMQMVKKQSIVHSYLFVGPKGIGKSLFAKEFAKICLCLEKEAPCGKCKSCIAIEASNHPDFYCAKPEQNSMKIEQMRSLTGKILEKPIISNKKIYVIDDADKMTKEAANSLLKTLEEPPEYVVIILIAESQGLLPSTICSRCLMIPFQKIEKESLKKYCAEYKTEEMKNVPDSMIESFDGSFANLTAANRNGPLYLELETIYTKIETFSKLEFISQLTSLYTKEKDQIDIILDYTSNILFQEMKINVYKKANFANCINAVMQAKINLKRNSNFDMTIDKLVFTIWEEMNETNCRR